MKGNPQLVDANILSATGLARPKSDILIMKLPSGARESKTLSGLISLNGRIA